MSVVPELFVDGNSWVIRRPKITVFDPTTGKWVPATGAKAITGTGFLSATEGGSALDPTLSVAIAEEGTGDGSYYALLSGSAMQSFFATYPDGQQLWECVSSPSGYRDDRPVVLRRNRRIVQP